MREKMQRVTKQKPCPICGKPDWCLVARDGNAAICSRIQEGSRKRCGDAGWLHVVGTGQRIHVPKRGKRRVPEKPQPRPDFDALSRSYEGTLTDALALRLAASLCVSCEAVSRLRLGWDAVAYTLPMYDGHGRIIGIQRRFLNGRKRCVPRSQLGVFMPSDLPETNVLYVTEGASDCLAALSWELPAIGRPSCSTGSKFIARIALDYERIVIIGDANETERKGAVSLARTLSLRCRDVRIIFPPDGTKDLRQWVQTGLDCSTLMEEISRIKPFSLAAEGLV